MSKTPSELLLSWITRQLSGPAKDWFNSQAEKLAADNSNKTFDIAFGMAPRKLGKDDLQLTEQDLITATATRPGWQPEMLSLDAAARVYFLLQVADDPAMPFVKRFKELHRTAEVGELLALYFGLPLYPDPESLIALAADGLRTNIRAEFKAVAHNNPFPLEQFGENPWNNMILKALFIGVMLEPIQGIDKRANPELARILRDYAHERWAAERFVSPELWRCIGPFAEGLYLDDFQRVINEGNETEKKAVALALTTSPASEQKTDLLKQLSEFDAAISQGDLTWASIADEMFDNSLAVTRRMNFEVELTK